MHSTEGYVHVSLHWWKLCWTS